MSLYQPDKAQEHGNMDCSLKNVLPDYYPAVAVEGLNHSSSGLPYPYPEPEIWIR